MQCGICVLLLVLLRAYWRGGTIFNNPIKVFFNNTYPVGFQKRITQIVNSIFLIGKTGFNHIFRDH